MNSQTNSASQISSIPDQATAERLRGRAVRQVGMLTAQFILGMAVNLIGVPGEAPAGLANIATTVFLALHVLIAIGLVVGAIFTYRQALPLGSPHSRLALWGMISVVVTFVAGVLTMISNAAGWSFLMALGFIVAFLIYGMLIMRELSVKAA